MLIHVDDETLSYEAEKSQYPLQFECGATDLISLEPIDNRLVPLRFYNLTKPDNIKLLEQDLRDFYSVIYENDGKIKIFIYLYTR